MQVTERMRGKDSHQELLKTPTLDKEMRRLVFCFNKLLFNINPFRKNTPPSKPNPPAAGEHRTVGKGLIKAHNNHREGQELLKRQHGLVLLPLPSWKRLCINICILTA